MYLSESLQTKWQGVLDHPDLPAIKDPYRKAVTAVILENQAQEMQKTAGMLYEAPTNSMGATNGGFQGGSAAAGPVAGFDPILISLVRRSLPTERIARGSSASAAQSRSLRSTLEITACAISSSASASSRKIAALRDNAAAIPGPISASIIGSTIFLTLTRENFSFSL